MFDYTLNDFQEGERVAKLLGVDCQDLYKNLLKPRIKVGNEFVTQGRNKDQVAYSVGAMSKAMFDRVFKWLVKKCNETLDTKQKRQHFIGVLDIAGFEIFDVSLNFMLFHFYFHRQTFINWKRNRWNKLEKNRNSLITLNIIYAI